MVLETIVINKLKDNIDRETITLSTTWYPLLYGLTVRGLTDRTNNAHSVTPTGQGPLTGPSISPGHFYTITEFACRRFCHSGLRGHSL